ncbi:MAG: element excision factor XisH family protein [Bacteroidota bacterium]
MAAKDIYHDVVRQALESDGWTVTHDPYRVLALGREAQIDLGAEKSLLGAEKDNQRIAIEIKSFINPSFVYDFHLALGQYLNYLLLLEEQDPERALFLAVKKETFETQFNHAAVKKALERYQMNILVFNEQTKTVELWKS